MMMTQPPSLHEIHQRADAAAARGAFLEARQLLEQAAALDPGSFDLHLKRAAMDRAAGDIDAALRALSQALALRPLDFMALLMRANLLDKLESGESGEAYARALAQAPQSESTPQIDGLIVRARVRHGEYVERTARIFEVAMAAAERKADPTQRKRMRRFRTNALKQTRVFHAEPTHFHYPGLREREFHDSDRFSWLARLEAATEAIRTEFHSAAIAERAQIVPYIQYPADVPLRQWEALNHSRAWTAIHLIQNGNVVEANARHCPQTMALLAELPQPHIAGRSPNAMFSLLAPGARIPPHNGVANTRLVCHLPLIVPPKCWFRVGEEIREWREGEAFIFDDTIEHEAANESNALRVVFIVDIWHPDLDPVERDAIAAMMVASEEATGGAL